MKNDTVKRFNRVVVPGEEIAVIEEFFEGENTYTIHGEIRAKILGVTEADLENHIISVKPVHENKPLVPRRDDVVLAAVETLKETSLAICSIFEIEGRGRLSVPFTGILHVSQVSSTYVKDIHDAVRVGDIIRAKVIGIPRPPFMLTTKGRDLGVILARCGRCLSILVKHGLTLMCPQCRVTAKRKISSKYMFVR